MYKEVRRINTADGTELANLADAVCTDKAARVIERDGQPTAAVVSLEDLERLLLLGPLPEAVRSAIISSGGWKDNELEADSLIDQIYRWRHEAPPSKPVTW
jgi:hypothetical protein